METISNEHIYTIKHTIKAPLSVKTLNLKLFCRAKILQNILSITKIIFYPHFIHLKKIKWKHFCNQKKKIKKKNCSTQTLKFVILVAKRSPSFIHFLFSLILNFKHIIYLFCLLFNKFVLYGTVIFSIIIGFILRFFRYIFNLKMLTR